MIMEIPEHLFVIDKTLKYKYANINGHTLSNKSNKVYEHIYVMCKHINRNLYPNEVVHHKDRDRSNNKLDNLLLLTQSEHMKLHQQEDGLSVEITNECKYCNKLIHTTEAVNQIYCGTKCYQEFRRKLTIEPEELSTLVWEIPTVKIAELYGVSDTAIDKRCKLFNIQKPPRGYWAKVAANKL